MGTSTRRAIFTNKSARSWVPDTHISETEAAAISRFHHGLPDFEATPLVSLDEVAHDLGIKSVFVKDESQRCGLPSFKILGASWAISRAISQLCELSGDPGIDDLGAAARKRGVVLYTATDGNHGRAVALMARILGIGAVVFVPGEVDRATRDFIAGEGAKVVVVEGDYDLAVRSAAREAARKGGTLIQDTAFEGYEEIPKEIIQWIVAGYSTMLREIDHQINDTSPRVLVVPVGVGSLAHSVVTHSKSAHRPTTILAVEPDTAACLWQSLQAGESTPIITRGTIMAGMNCGTVSTTAWPILKAGVDASVTVSDFEAHQAVLYLRSKGVLAGPCGAAPLAALLRVARTQPEAANLTADSTVILICSEGPREYEIPKGVDADSQSAFIVNR